MSNLCQEITLPTNPLSHIDDENGEIALCILSAINVGKLRNLDELEELCDLSVRGLDALIDFKDILLEQQRLAPRTVVLWALVILVWHTILLSTKQSIVTKRHGTLS